MWSSRWSRRRAPVLHRVLHRVHFLFQAEPPEHLGGFAGERLADMKARKFLLFENDRSNAFAKQKHGCGRATGTAAENEDINFHNFVI